jgi:hypothetical protein
MQRSVGHFERPADPLIVFIFILLSTGAFVVGIPVP